MHWRHQVFMGKQIVWQEVVMFPLVWCRGDNIPCPEGPRPSVHNWTGLMRRGLAEKCCMLLLIDLNLHGRCPLSFTVSIMSAGMWKNCLQSCSPSLWSGLWVGWQCSTNTKSQWNHYCIKVFRDMQWWWDADWNSFCVSICQKLPERHSHIFRSLLNEIPPHRATINKGKYRHPMCVCVAN